MKVIDLDHFTPEKRRELTRKEKKIILKAYGYHCANRNCIGTKETGQPQAGKGITAFVDVIIANVEFHHRIPLSKGGFNELHNFAPLCNLCHKYLTEYNRTSKLSPNSIEYTFLKLKSIPTYLKKMRPWEVYQKDKRLEKG